MRSEENLVLYRLPRETISQPYWLTKMILANRLLSRRAQRHRQWSWLIQMVCANRGLARRARRYLEEKDERDYIAYVQVLKLIRRAKIYSKTTGATDLRMAFLKACDAAAI